MERTITLIDGEHIVRTPSYYGLQLIDEYGGNEGALMGRLPKVLAALLTDSEPLDAKGLPKRTWDPVAVAKLIPLDVSAESLWETIGELLNDALPDSKAASSDRPPRRPGEPKPSGRAASSPA